MSNALNNYLLVRLFHEQGIIGAYGSNHVKRLFVFITIFMLNEHTALSIFIKVKRKEKEKKNYSCASQHFLRHHIS